MAVIIFSQKYVEIITLLAVHFTTSCISVIIGFDYRLIFALLRTVITAMFIISLFDQYGKYLCQVSGSSPLFVTSAISCSLPIRNLEPVNGSQRFGPLSIQCAVARS